MSGGVNETDEKELIVIPSLFPSCPIVVTRQTPVGNDPKDLRKVFSSSGAVPGMGVLGQENIY
jgi:hypothetical protein